MNKKYYNSFGLEVSNKYSTYLFNIVKPQFKTRTTQVMYMDEEIIVEKFTTKKVEPKKIRIKKIPNKNKDIYFKYLNSGLCENGLCEIDNKDTAIVLLHGYGQTSKIHMPYIEKLKELGDVFAPTLTGHFESEVVDIKSYKELITPNLKLLTLLKKHYKRIILIGYSLGGIVSIKLASRIRPDKLILISTPIKYNFDAFKRSAQYLLAKYKEVKNTKESLGLKTYLEMYRIASHAKRRLKYIDCDVLCIHGELDELNPIEQSRYILDKISSQNREFYIAKGVDHFTLEHHEVILPKIIEYITRK